MADGFWVGVDLDGTLACCDKWRGAEHIGPAIPEMLERVHGWLAEGKTVKIFTARASCPGQIPFVKRWLEEHGIGHLEVTNIKDYRMIELWDDRCVQVVPNTGVPVVGPLHHGQP